MAIFEKAVRDHLASLDLRDSTALAPEWQYGWLQESPDFAVCVLGTGGNAPRRTLAEFPSFTVRVRHPNAAEATEFLRRVFKALHEFSSPNMASSGVGVARIRATQGPVPIGRDGTAGKGRWVVQQDFAAIAARY